MAPVLGPQRENFGTPEQRTGRQQNPGAPKQALDLAAAGPAGAANRNPASPPGVERATRTQTPFFDPQPFSGRPGPERGAPLSPPRSGHESGTSCSGCLPK
jgi:hypothetical protein